jgi:hypothetical protein
MATRSLTFTDTVHRDVYLAVRAMPRLTATVVVLLILQAILELTASIFIPEQSLLGSALVTIVYYVLITPFLIAVHRFIILGEVTDGYRLGWRDRRYQLFFGWASVVLVLSQLPDLMSKLPGDSIAPLLLVLASYVAIVIIFIRSMILFPAIAVDAPGATLRHAFADSKGHVWMILSGFIVPFTPSGIVVALIVLAAFFELPLAGSALMLGLLGLIKMFWIVLAVAIASRLYIGLGDRLRRVDASLAEA